MNTVNHNGTTRRRYRVTTAFSLIEMLVTVSIISILITIALPVLTQARESALVVAATQHQRQVAISLSHYADDNSETFPYWGKPGTNDADLYYESRMIYENAHWAHPYAWGMYLEDHGYDGLSSASSGTGVIYGGDSGGKSDLGRFFLSLHNITHAAYAEPAYFDGNLGSQIISRYRAMRLTDAAHPSKKGMIWAPLGQFGFRPATARHTPYIATLCDLHTESTDRSRLLEPIAMNNGWNVPFATTRNGMLGRDIR